MFEYGGELFDNEADFLKVLSEEYRRGDRQLVLDTLEEYGFELSDLKGVESNLNNPIAAAINLCNK